MSKPTVIVVDDSLYMRTVIKEALSEAGYEVLAEAGTGEAAIDQALEHKPQLITLDNILPDMLGLDVLSTLKDEGVQSRIVMISAVGQESVVDEGLKRGADQYVVKPFTSEQLLEVIDKVLAD